MTGAIEKLRDLGTLMRTDKRFWSAGGFLAVVLSIWLVTDAWRAPEPEKEKLPPRVKPEEEIIHKSLIDFQKTMELDRLKRQETGEVLKRTEGEFQVTQKQIDGTLDSLVSKLDRMANRVDQLADKIGSRALEITEVDEKIAKEDRKKRKGKTPRKVDPAEL